MLVEKKMYHVVVKSETEKDFKDYVTKVKVDKQTANLIKAVVRNQIDEGCYIELEEVAE